MTIMGPGEETEGILQEILARKLVIPTYREAEARQLREGPREVPRVLPERSGSAAR
jgi:hypothetical protein